MRITSVISSETWLDSVTISYWSLFQFPSVGPLLVPASTVATLKKCDFMAAVNDDVWVEKRNVGSKIVVSFFSFLTAWLLGWAALPISGEDGGSDGTVGIEDVAAVRTFSWLFLTGANEVLVMINCPSSLSLLSSKLARLVGSDWPGLAWEPEWFPVGKLFALIFFTTRSLISLVSLVSLAPTILSGNWVSIPVQIFCGFKGEGRGLNGGFRYINWNIWWLFWPDYYLSC